MNELIEFSLDTENAEKIIISQNGMKINIILQQHILII